MGYWLIFYRILPPFHKECLVSKYGLSEIPFPNSFVLALLQVGLLYFRCKANYPCMAARIGSHLLTWKQERLTSHKPKITIQRLLTSIMQRLKPSMEIKSTYSKFYNNLLIGSLDRLRSLSSNWFSQLSVNFNFTINLSFSQWTYFYKSPNSHFLMLGIF